MFVVEHLIDEPVMDCQGSPFELPTRIGPPLIALI